MNEQYLTVAVHEEYAKRMEDEHKRQNKRISDLETTVKNIGSLTASVASLAKSVEQMAKTQEKQGKRLEVLEGRDGEKWRTVAGYVLTAIISAVLSFVLAKIGLQ